MQSSPSALKALLLASRPKTLAAGLSPVLLGTSMAAFEGSIDLPIFFLTLFFSLFIQIGTNYANDAFDFKNGADTEERIGPVRATQRGWLSYETMLKASFSSFLLALLAAIPLMMRAGWWSFPLALLSVLFGLLYTGGPKPLGYLGLGEVLVFLFFGPIAAVGAYYLQTTRLSIPILLASLSPGFLSCSILIANNLRDEISDRKAKKNTLVVRWGKRFGAWEYLLSTALAALPPVGLVFFFNYPYRLLLGILPFFFFIPLIRTAFSFKHPAEIIDHLAKSALILLAFTLIFSLLLLV